MPNSRLRPASSRRWSDPGSGAAEHRQFHGAAGTVVASQFQWRDEVQGWPRHEPGLSPSCGCAAWIR